MYRMNNVAMIDAAMRFHLYGICIFEMYTKFVI